MTPRSGRESQFLVIAVVLKVTAKDALVSSDARSQKPSQKRTEFLVGLRRATGSADLAWLSRVVSPKPESHVRERDAEEATQGQGQQRCSPSQVEVGWLIVVLVYFNSAYLNDFKCRFE